jgi:hypothetical protein
MTGWEFADRLLNGSYPMGVMLFTAAIMIAVFVALRKPLIKYVLHEKLGVATKSELANAVRDLKDNDFYHTNKALLLIGAEVLKNSPERFNRVKETILETTPDSRKEEIKAITL